MPLRPTPVVASGDGVLSLPHHPYYLEEGESASRRDNITAMINDQDLQSEDVLVLPVWKWKSKWRGEKSRVVMKPCEMAPTDEEMDRLEGEDP